MLGGSVQSQDGSRGSWNFNIEFLTHSKCDQLFSGCRCLLLFILHGWGDPRASYCEEFLRQYTCWLLRSHSSQQPAKTLPEKHPQQPRTPIHPSVCPPASSQPDPGCPLMHVWTSESGSVDAFTSASQMFAGAMLSKLLDNLQEKRQEVGGKHDKPLIV